MSNNGVKKLGALLRSEMHKVNEYNISTSIVFGKITSGKGLKMDGVDYTIPRKEYLVCRSCAAELSVGHRVLVGIYNNEPVVIDILT